MDQFLPSRGIVAFLFVSHRKACETLLKLGAEVDSKDNNSRTALMWSVKNNNLQCAKILLDFKASVDLQDTDGDSALHVACGQGHAAIVRLLLDRGASLTLCNKRGNGCLEIAAKAGSSDVAMTIVTHKRYVAVRGNETDAIIMLYQWATRVVDSYFRLIYYFPQSYVYQSAKNLLNCFSINLLVVQNLTCKSSKSSSRTL